MQQQIVEAYVGLGSNLGDAGRNLQLAAALLSSLKDVYPGRKSRVYYTEPQGVKDQPWFANQVQQLYCGPQWNPRLLLQTMLRLESSLGRVRDRIWGARSIDLDLLLFGRKSGIWQDLILPHPRLEERAFVLVPLAEIAPQLKLSQDRSPAQLLQKLSYKIQGNRIWQE
ncbi:MAG: 2-amino-4-hydroxy-6-hydroxymethyldihydropteridine diphosphokinase [Desulfohalobiaceae bacterium]